MSHISHRTYADAQIQGIRCGVLTISDTRTVDNDSGGQLAQRLLTDGGHHVTQYAIVRDEPLQVVAHIEAWVAGSPRNVITE